jgi:antitoxin VapB
MKKTLNRSLPWMSCANPHSGRRFEDAAVVPRADPSYIHHRISRGGQMATARVFRSGNSQAVRLPKEYRLKSREVEIFRRGDEIVLREKGKGLTRAFEILANLPDDFFPEGRGDSKPQKRKGL